MIKINPPIFIPENAKFIKKMSSIMDDQMILTYEEKVKRNPYLREIFRMETIETKERTVKQVPEKKRSIELKPVSKEKTGYAGKLEYIKNLTDSILLLYVEDENAKSKSVRGVKGTPLYKYTRKNSLSEKQLKSYELKVLYEDGRIEDITKEQFESELRSLYNGVDPLKPAVISGDGARSVHRDDGDRKSRSFVTNTDAGISSTIDLSGEGQSFTSEEESLLNQFGLRD